MKGKWKLFGASLLLCCSLVSVIGLSNPASATPTLICTWTGAAGLNPADLSVADNWSPNSGESCGGASTLPSSATLSGAQLVFPATNSNSSYSLSIDEPENIDDMVFQASYSIVGSNVLTLTPANNGGIGIDAAAGTSTINAPVTLGQSQTFEALNGTEVELAQSIAGGSYGLTTGNTGETGTIYIDQSSSYSGGTTVALGVLQIGNSVSLGSGAVIVDSGASLETNSSVSGSSITPSNALTITGAGATGSGGALVDYTGGNGWSGAVTLGAGATVADQSASKPFTITGAISGSGPLTTSGSGTVNVASSSYSGGTIVSQGTLQNGSTGAIPDAALSVASGATYDLSGYSQSLVDLSGPGRVTSSSGLPTLTISVPAGSSDTIGTTCCPPAKLIMQTT